MSTDPPAAGEESGGNPPDEYVRPELVPVFDQGARDVRADPYGAVRGPAIGLMVVSIVWLVILCLGLAFSAFLLASGAADRMRQPLGMSKTTQIAIRMSWAGVMVIANTVVLIAAIRMRQLRNYTLAIAGSIVAVVPCIGPCYLLGIPFGIWALVALSKPDVKDAFREVARRI